MSLYDSQVSREIVASDPPFAALVMAAMRKADSINAAKIRSVFPVIRAELEARYEAPGGVLPTDVRPAIAPDEASS